MLLRFGVKRLDEWWNTDTGIFGSGRVRKDSPGALVVAVN